MRPGAQLAGALDVERPQAGCTGFGHIQRRFVRRQTDAVGRVDRVHEFRDRAAVGARVVHGAAVDGAPAALAEIAEVEAAVAVEHQIVRPFQRLAVALGVECLHRACFQIYRLDAATLIVRRERIAGTAECTMLHPSESSVVAYIHAPVRTHRRTVRAAAAIGDDADLALGADAAQRAPLDLDQDD